MTANDNSRNGWWQRLGASSGFMLAVIVQTGGLVWWASGITQTQKIHGEEIVALRRDLRDLAKILADSTGPAADIKARLVAVEREVARVQGDVENIKKLAGERTPMYEDWVRSRGWKK